MKRTDPMEVMSESYRNAYKIIRDTMDRVQAEVITRPADPNAKKLSDAEFLAEYRKMDDPAVLQSQEAMVRDRFHVVMGRVPRRLVKFVMEGERIKAKFERGEFDRAIAEAEAENEVADAG